jgi:hypothetical protein
MARAAATGETRKITDLPGTSGHFRAITLVSKAVSPWSDLADRNGTSGAGNSGANSGPESAPATTGRAQPGVQNSHAVRLKPGAHQMVCLQKLWADGPSGRKLPSPICMYEWLLVDVSDL